MKLRKLTQAKKERKEQRAYSRKVNEEEKARSRQMKEKTSRLQAMKMMREQRKADHVKLRMAIELSQ